MGSVFRPAGRTKYKIKYCGADGRWITESTGSDDVDEATKVLASREGKIAEGVPLVRGVGTITLEEAQAAVAADYRANNYDSLDAMARRYRLHLEPYFGGDRKLASLTTGAIRAYIDHRLAEPVQELRTYRNGTTVTVTPKIPRTTARATVNRELALLDRMCNLAIENGALLHGPHIPMLKEAPPRKGFLEADQFAAIVRHLDAYLAPIARFAYITGWRVPSEILTLKWSQVDFTARVSPSQGVAGTVTIAVGDDKNERGRVFPMNAELRRVLEGQVKIRTQCRKRGILSPYVFVRISKTGLVAQVVAFLPAWHRATHKAGHPGKLPHDFRRTAARNLVRAGVSESVAMRLTGHKTRAVFERYNIVADSDLAAAVARLESGTKSGTKQGAFWGHSGKVGTKNP